MDDILQADVGQISTLGVNGVGPIHDEIHRMVDGLSEKKALVVKQLLEVLLDQDWDSEPLTATDLADIAEARTAHKRGESIPLQDLERELDGLNAEEDRRRD